MSIATEIFSHSDLFADAYALWGEEVLFRWLQEELAECSVAVSHYRREKVDGDKVLDEAADALLMIMQVARHFGPNRFNEIVERKLRRLRKKIDGKQTFGNEASE